MLPEIRHQIAAHVAAAIARIAPDAPVATVTLDRPKVAAHGDLATSIALQLAKPLKKNPRELAQAIVDALLADASARTLIAHADVAGPGFVNLTVQAAVKQAVVRRVLDDGDRYGRNDAHRGARVMVEFVSANPTGPLHVGHGRQAALGDAIAHLLATQGFEVSREFYYNDAGAQIHNLALSVQARARGVAPDDPRWPDDGYRGEYIADIAADFLAKQTVQADDRAYTASGNVDDLESIRLFAVAYLRREQDLDLQAFGVHFDRYYLESSLYTEGRVERTVQALVAAGKTYEHEGALWLRTTDDGDDKDRVMRKSDGSYTYFVPDVAYHVTKWERGFAKVVDVQGSDHHGTIARVRAGLQATGMGIPVGYPDYVLHKMVTVMRGGEEVKISKRAGSYVTLRDLIDWTGRDAVRFFLSSRKADTEFVFDVDLALKQNDENPVYYVQYAHARISSVLAAWQTREGGDVAALRTCDLAPLTGDKADALMQRLADYPGVLAQAAAEFAPHQVAFYARELAADFHSFYNTDRVLVDATEVKHARLALLLATRQVLRDALALLGVSAPDKM